MCTLLYNIAMVKHNDIVGITYRAKTMRYYYNGLAFVKHMQVGHNLSFVVGVKGICCLIKEYIIRLLIYKLGLLASAVVAPD